MEKEEEVRKGEEDYGSAWPGHHTPLLMDRWVGSTARSHPLLPSVVRTLPLHLPLVAHQSAGSHKWATATRFLPSPVPLPSTSTSSSSSGRLRSPCLAVAKLGKSPCGWSESQPKQSQVFFLFLVCKYGYYSLQMIDILCNKYLIFFAND